MVNYLARLGWSHGDDEIFSREQFLAWFNLDHLGRSAAQFDEAKLRWVNAQHLKALDNEVLAGWVKPFVESRGLAVDDRLPAMCGLFKDRCDTLVALADWVVAMLGAVKADDAVYQQHITDAIRPALSALAQALSEVAWDKTSIAAAIKQVLSAQGLKMPQLAMPVRVLVLGTPQTPSLDAVLELMTREKVLAALQKS